MLPRFRPFLITISALSGVFLLASTAHAFPPNDLAEAIKQSTDRDRRRIPLLVLNPEQTRMSWQDKSHLRLYELYREGNAKPPLTEVLPIFKRQIISCSSVQIIAPLQRITLNPYPGPPEEWARIGRERAARLLFASLSTAQWATASSTNGLGVADLQKQEQKAWFLSLIPEPFILQEMQYVEQGGTSTLLGANGEPNKVPVAPERVRVRVVRSMQWYYRSGPQSGYSSYGDVGSENRLPGQKFWMQASQPEGQETSESYRDRLKEAVQIEKPNRLQKGDLPFNTAPLFGKNIPLAGAKTLGDLVQRVAEATGVELYADRRLTGLPVTIIGSEDATVDAADLMKALCLATTGTIRKVTDPRNNDTVYLLAGDQDALMPPRLRLAEWASDVDALLNGEQTAFHKVARESGVVGGIGFAEDAAGKISDTVMQAAEERITDPNRYQRNDGFIPIPVSALPAEGQEKVRRDLERSREYASSNEAPLDQKNVYAQFSVQTQLLVPGYGAFSGPSLTSLDSLLKRKPAPPAPPRPAPPPGVITLPPPLQQFAALKIATKDDDEVETAAKWAARRGFCALFVRASLWEGGEPERLSRLATIGAKYGVKIYPVISLLRTPPAESAKKEAPHNLARARNVFGESLREYAYRRKDAPALLTNKYEADQIAPYRDTDWLDASDEAVQKTVAERLAALAKVPGIAGMIWENVAAPGTAISGYSWTSGSIAGRHAGFSDTLRVAFIRQENADPLDLPPYGNIGPYIDWSSGDTSPFMGNEWEVQERFRQHPAYRKDAATGTWKAEKSANSSDYNFAAAAWNTLVRERNRSWIGAIRKEAKLPDSLPIFVEGPTDQGYSLSQWTAPWAASDPLMPKEMGKEPLLPLTIRRESTPVSVRTGLSTQLIQRLGKGKKPAFSGLVIDLTAKPLDDGLSLLSPLAVVGK
ncbi:MAG: hypothetical protein H8F28_02435 [Fibrella sp.]|nr:hypothetical protein [Armatimonadota bacterium]